MPIRLRKEITKIKKQILTLGAMVEKSVHDSIYAMENDDIALAREIVNSDFLIDDLEIEIEEECFKILALYQPISMDLRFIVTVIKINNDLERIGDYAANIAKRFEISYKDKDKFSYDYTAMAELTVKMLKMSLDALVDMDEKMAHKVREMDSNVNLMRDEAYHIMKKNIKTSPDNASEIINMYLVSRHLERIGDHTKNIAEEVIYLIQGNIIRHT